MNQIYFAFINFIQTNFYYKNNNQLNTSVYSRKKSALIKICFVNFTQRFCLKEFSVSKKRFVHLIEYFSECHEKQINVLNYLKMHSFLIAILNCFINVVVRKTGLWKKSFPMILRVKRKSLFFIEKI